jgi:hypothetical protein
MTYIERIHDISTGETIDREYTAEQIAEAEANVLKENSRAEAEATKAAEKAAVLAKLGLTADEVTALLS